MNCVITSLHCFKTLIFSKIKRSFRDGYLTEIIIIGFGSKFGYDEVEGVGLL